MVLSCGLLDVMDLIWWQPYHTPLERGGSRRHSSAWLPGAIEITSDPDKAEVCTLFTPALQHAYAGSEQIALNARLANTHEG